MGLFAVNDSSALEQGKMYVDLFRFGVASDRGSDRGSGSDSDRSSDRSSNSVRSSDGDSGSLLAISNSAVLCPRPQSY